jgi:two-component system chemotaxis response regulator CheB
MPATYTCPECGGNMWEIKEDETTVFQCHTGHTLSPENLLGQQSEVLERTLWSALRGAVERGVLLREMANRARERGTTAESRAFESRMAGRLEGMADAANRDADELRRVIANLSPNPTDEDMDELSDSGPAHRHRSRNNPSGS